MKYLLVVKHAPWVCIIFVTLFAFFRIWPNVATPSLFMEDSFEYFRALNQETSLFEKNYFNLHGYYTFLSILIAWVWSFLPQWWQPFFYTFSAFFIAIAPVWFVCLARVFRSSFFMVVAVVSLVMIGINHVFLYTALCYSPYMLVILLLLIMVFAAPDSCSSVAWHGILLSILVWSGPYCVLAIPVGILLILIRRNFHVSLVCIIVIANAVVYYLVTQNVESDFQRFFQMETFWKFTQSLVEQIFLFGLVQLSYVTDLIVLLLIGSIFMIFSVKDKNFSFLAVIFFSIILGSHFLFYISSKYFMYIEPKPGHLEIGTFFWVILLLKFVEKIYLTCREKLISGGLIVSILTLVIVCENLSSQNSYYVEPDKRLKPFLKAIPQVDAIMRKKKDSYVILQMYESGLAPAVRLGSRSLSARKIKADEPDIPASIRRYVNNDDLPVKPGS